MSGRICAWKDEWPVVIFTNGACEDEGRLVTHGAVLCDWSSGTFWFSEITFRNPS